METSRLASSDSCLPGKVSSLKRNQLNGNLGQMCSQPPPQGLFTEEKPIEWKLRGRCLLARSPSGLFTEEKPIEWKHENGYPTQLAQMSLH